MKLYIKHITNVLFFLDSVLYFVAGTALSQHKFIIQVEFLNAMFEVNTFIKNTQMNLDKFYILLFFMS